MNILAAGLANAPAVVGEMPLRDTCVIVLMFAGIALLLVGAYLLFAGVESAVYPTDPVRIDE